MTRINLVDRDNPTASPTGFLDAEEAFRRLRDAALDQDNLQHFREVFHQVNLGGGADAPSDRRVLAGLAGRLAEGSLRFAGEPREVEADPTRHAGAVMPGPPKPAPAAPAPATPGEPGLKLRPPPVPQAPALPEAVTDYLTQAQCLVDAAASGAPFVEQCAR